MTNVQQAIPKGAVEFRRSARDEHTMSKIKRPRNASCCAELATRNPADRVSTASRIAIQGYTPELQWSLCNKSAGYCEHVCSCMFCISVARPVAHFAYINLGRHTGDVSVSCLRLGLALLRDEMSMTTSIRPNSLARKLG